MNEQNKLRYREEIGSCQRGKGLGLGEMGERDQEVQSSIYKTNRLWGRMNSMATTVNNTVLQL